MKHYQLYQNYCNNLLITKPFYRFCFFLLCDVEGKFSLSGKEMLPSDSLEDDTKFCSVFLLIFKLDLFFFEVRVTFYCNLVIVFLIDT